MTRNDDASRRFRPSLSQLEARETPATLFRAFGAAPGGVPLVEVQNPDGSVFARFEAFETSFRGGVRAAAGELNGDPASLEVVATSGPGGGPRVRVFSVSHITGEVTPTHDFFAFEPEFRDGVRVAVGRVFGNANVVNPRLAQDQIILGTDAGGGPRVRVLALGVTDGVPIADFFAFEPEFRGGVRVASGDVAADSAGAEEVIVGAGPGGGPRVRVLRVDGPTVSDDFAFPPDVTTGVNVAVVGGQVVTDTLAEDVSQRNAALNALALQLAAPPAAPAPADDGFTFSLTPGQPAGVGISGLAAVGAPGVVFGSPATTPGLFSTGGPGIAATGTSGPGVVFGTASMGSFVISTPATTAGVFSSAATAPGVFSTAATAPGLFSVGGPGIAATGTSGPGVVFGSATTAPGVVFGSALTAPGVFGGATTGGTGF
jgi:hypothetical protein